MRTAHLTIPPDADVRPRPLARERISVAHAGLTLLVGRGLHVPLAGGVTLDVAFAGAEVASEDDVALEGLHGALTLHAGVPFLLALTGIDIAAFDTAPPAQRDWLHASLLGRLAGSPFGGMTRLVRHPAPLTDVPDAATLRLSLRDGSHAVGTLATAGADCWHALLAAQPLHRTFVPLDAFTLLTVPLIARIARHALAPAVLRTLQAGDVIVPSRPDVDVHGEGWLRCAGRLARVRYGHAGTVEILSLESAMEAMNETTEAHDEMAVPPGVDGAVLDVALPDIDNTPVRLEFRLGALALTLAQLRTLAPGAIFQLDGSADGAIAIVCGGQRLGEGEAVDVAGRLGIRITRWDVPC
ncbi:type III secretion system cytoplasmic ring protein SctQ [Pseudoduganella plicata]|uniref:Type III secretion system protein n=1 Tax=Pseudoduganella plicata TaxID=321984 RepID=A0A4P7BAG8_9BURK|nr:type III secretion system cytoplasmic ring protein SctQ [Pseudoduganella plicata]QBQ35424.1 YscQ/HrcQ family type III secretion apparatus protein [Pseudoduganella plicata]GGZ01630.1 type III secretion system protein [Pseudoduganella plicata]